MFSLFTAIFIFKSSKARVDDNCFVDKTIILVFDGLITKFAFLDHSSRLHKFLFKSRLQLSRFDGLQCTYNVVSSAYW